MNEGYYWRIFMQDAIAGRHSRHSGLRPQVMRIHYMRPDRATSAGYVTQREPVEGNDVSFTISSNYGVHGIEDVPVDSLVDGMNKIEWLTYEARKQEEKQS
jgi:hypothetical protein